MACVAGIAAAVLVVPAYIVGPVDRAIRRRAPAVRFQLIDLTSLVVLLQVGLAGTLAAYPRTEFETSSPRIGLAIFICLLVTAVWGGGVRAMLYAAVDHWLRRAVFVLVVLPGTLGVTYLGVAASVGLILWPLLLLVWFPVVGATLLLRRIVEWILAGPATS